MENLYFKIFTNCFIYTGTNRSLIIDIQRENFIGIPNSLADIINLLKNKNSIEDIKKKYGEQNECIIDEYLNFLIVNEFGILCESVEFDSFIDMDNSFFYLLKFQIV